MPPGATHLPELAATLKQHGKTLIAEKIETHQDFEEARKLGFDLFQGYFFARPQVLVTRRSNPSRTALLRLLGVLSGEPDISELEAELKLNPNVVVQLLRLANSSAFKLSRPVSSLREAIARDRHAADFALDPVAALRRWPPFAVAFGPAGATGRDTRALHGTGGA